MDVYSGKPLYSGGYVKLIVHFLGAVHAFDPIAC